MTNSTKPKPPAMAQVQRVILRAALGFATFVVLQWGLLALHVFGSTPVIPVAFFCCVDILILVAVLPMVVFGFALQVMARRLLWRFWVASGLIAFAVWLASQLLVNL